MQKLWSSLFRNKQAFYSENLFIYCLLLSVEPLAVPPWTLPPHLPVISLCKFLYLLFPFFIDLPNTCEYLVLHIVNLCK